MRDLEFWSQDGRFGLRVAAVQTKAILSACRSAGRNETGGILVGVYSPKQDCAIVHHACGPAPDSRFGRTWFHRGVRGVQRTLDRYWSRRTGFYLGEWHFHPHAAPVPSDVDHRSMHGIASSSLYNCPEPVLLLIGGDPAGQWAATASVFPRGEGPIALDRTWRSA